MPSAQAPNYDQTVVDKIRDLIESTDSDGIYHKVLYGEPEEGISIDILPCVCIHLLSTKIEQDSTAHDKLTQTILIRVIINKFGYMDEGSNDDVMTQRELEQKIQGMVNGTYDPTSIAGILRKNFTLINYATNNLLDIQYGQHRDPMQNEITVEGQVRATIETLVISAPKL